MIAGNLFEFSNKRLSEDKSWKMVLCADYSFRILKFHSLRGLTMELGTL